LKERYLVNIFVIISVLELTERSGILLIGIELALEWEILQCMVCWGL
jgi:hypothetical protein